MMKPGGNAQQRTQHQQQQNNPPPPTDPKRSCQLRVRNWPELLGIDDEAWRERPTTNTTPTTTKQPAAPDRSNHILSALGPELAGTRRNRRGNRLVTPNHTT